MARYDSLTERFEANSQTVDRGYETPCKEWTGNVNNDGYARYSVRCCGKVEKRYVYRTAYELEVAAIPADHQIDHLCVNPRCWNTDHLEVVTNAVNTQRRDQRRAARNVH